MRSPRKRKQTGWDTYHQLSVWRQGPPAEHGSSLSTGDGDQSSRRLRQPEVVGQRPKEKRATWRGCSRSLRGGPRTPGWAEGRTCSQQDSGGPGKEQLLGEAGRHPSSNQSEWTDLTEHPEHSAEAPGRPELGHQAKLDPEQRLLSTSGIQFFLKRAR